MDKHERQLQRLRDWYKNLSEEERDKRRAAQREYRRKQRELRRDEINAYKRQNRAEKRDEVNAQQRAYYEAHKEQFRIYQQTAQARHAEEYRARARDRYWRKQGEGALERRRERDDRSLFFKTYKLARTSYYNNFRGMDWEHFKRFYLQSIKGPCEICGVTTNGDNKRLVIDHHHKSRTFRGILCDPCNRGLGCFKDDPERCRKAADYLDKAKGA